MSSAQFKITEPTQTPSLKRLVLKYLYHWPLFFIAIPVAIAAGLFYLKTTKPAHRKRLRLKR